MEFVVVFKAWEDGFAFDMTEELIGLNQLEEAREKFGQLPETDLEVNFDSAYSDPQITISEEEAREAGHFSNTSRVRVSVPVKALNKFVSFSYNKEDKVVLVTAEADVGKVVAAWLSAGAPLSWAG